MQQHIKASQKMNPKHLIIALIAAFLGLLVIIKNFIITLVIAFLLSALLKPLYLKLVNTFNLNKKLGVFVSLIVLLCLLIIPFIFLMFLLSTQALQVSDSVKPMLEQAVENTKSLDLSSSGLLENFNLHNFNKDILNNNLVEIISQASEFFGKSIFSITSKTLELGMLVLVGLYAFCYLLYQPQKLYQIVGNYFPTIEDKCKIIYQRLVDMSGQVLKSIMIIGIMQGLIIGVSLAILNIPGSAIWGLIIVILSPIPGIGAGLIWLPIVIYLLWYDLWAKAIILLIVGLIVSVGDNFLRPSIIGKKMQVPNLLLLVSILGAIAMFGISGLLLGPLVLIVFLTLLEFASDCKK